MAVSSARRANKHQSCIGAPASRQEENNGFPRVALSPSSTRSRSSLSRVPATPWSQVAASEKDVMGGHGTKKTNSAANAPKKAYIALGSNMGDRVGMIEQACKALTSRGIRVKRASSLWETEPMYVLDQENFINGACEVSAKQSFRVLSSLAPFHHVFGRVSFTPPLYALQLLEF